MTRKPLPFVAVTTVALTLTLTARSETPAAFGRRCIPAGCVAPRSNTPGIAPHRAQDARWGPRSALVTPLHRGPHGADCAPWGGTSGRIAALGATLEFHHGLLEDVIAFPWKPCGPDQLVVSP